MHTVGSLFAGIGGFDLGFERAGFKTVWQVEKNADCRIVLRSQFPNADRGVTDVRFAGARNLAAVDVICGGWPCQDISVAQTGGWLGLDGDRSGLFFHFVRIIGELRPRAVAMENVAALLGRGMGRVLGALAAIGYDAEWDCISASAIGAIHQRNRVWIVAYPREKGWAGRVFGPSFLESAKAALSQLGHDMPGGWGDLPAVVQRIPHSNGLSVGMVRRLVSPFGNAVVPQIPELIAQRLKAVIGGE
jgi:DNA (cytosine-5)-methyltransferase 1